jgi:hypothetical protein
VGGHFYSHTFIFRVRKSALIQLLINFSLASAFVYSAKRAINAKRKSGRLGKCRERKRGKIGSENKILC